MAIRKPKWIFKAFILHQSPKGGRGDKPAIVDVRIIIWYYGIAQKNGNKLFVLTTLHFVSNKLHNCWERTFIENSSANWQLTPFERWVIIGALMTHYVYQVIGFKWRIVLLHREIQSIHNLMIYTRHACINRQRRMHFASKPNRG
jgi:hypothetical protein